MVIIIALLIALALVAMVLLPYVYSYWMRRGIPQLQPSFPFGNFGPFFRQRQGMPMLYADLYEKSKHLPFVGIYIAVRPTLIINDPVLVKNILSRDFEHFHDRGLYVNEEQDPLTGHLFALSGEKWRNLRAKLTPIFSSGRLKGMFPILVETGSVMQEYISKRAGEVVDMRDLAGRYITDVIASVAFGIQIDSINNTEDIFRKMGSQVLHHNVKNSLRLASVFFLPKLKALLGFKFVDQDVEDFMINIVRETLEYRESSDVSRKDMMQLLLQLRNNGTVSNDDRWSVEVSTTPKALSYAQVTAQAFVFFVAALETSSTTISFCLFELARNAELQTKVRDEIDAVLSRSCGILTYDNLSEMKFLECCLQETLRKYPAVPFLNRECTKAYQIPQSKAIIERGSAILIPVIGIHRDARYFPNPEKFDPERFCNAEDMTEKPYFPFGDGPRTCIGMRMARIQTKVALAILLAQFYFRLPSEEYRHKELPLNSSSLILSPVGGVQLIAAARQ